MKALGAWPRSKEFWRHAVALLFALVGGAQMLADWGDKQWELPESLVFACMLAVFLIALKLELEDEHARRPFLIARPDDLVEFNETWLRTGGHVVIVTRDFSWSLTPSVLQALKGKAEKRELTLILHSSDKLTDELKDLGGEIITTQDLAYTAKLRFSISRYGAADSVVLFHTVDNGKVVFVRRTHQDFPEFWLAQDMVELLRRTRGAFAERSPHKPDSFAGEQVEPLVQGDEADG